MSILGERLSAPAPTDHDVEQVLLGLADGSYVLSTPDGALAECGVGVVALLGASAEQLAGRPVTDVLAAATDPAQRAAFERLLHGERDDTRQAFATTTAGGAPRSLRFVVVSVPLELGWESRRCSASCARATPIRGTPRRCGCVTSARWRPSSASASPAPSPSRARASRAS